MCRPNDEKINLSVKEIIIKYCFLYQFGANKSDREKKREPKGNWK